MNPPRPDQCRPPPLPPPVRKIRLRRKKGIDDEQSCLKVARQKSTVAVALLGLALWLAVSAWAAQSADPAPERRFSSPDDAINALAAAAKAQETNTMRAIFGPAAQELVSPDVVQATEEPRSFSASSPRKSNKSAKAIPGSACELARMVGPFPFPWSNKTGNGSSTSTRVVRRTLTGGSAGTRLAPFASAKLTWMPNASYALQDRDGDGVRRICPTLAQFPGRIMACSGRPNLARTQSLRPPLPRPGVRVTAARQNPERTANALPRILFKILTQQGKHAPGGKYNYIINGHMIAGFGLVAWPAEWGNSGVMTFMVNHQGKVFQKNLGPKTASIAAGMKSFDLDSSWTPASD